MGKFSAISLNTRGIRNEFKRCSLFNWLKKKHYDLYFLQETHSDTETEAKWKLQWDGEIIRSHGTNYSSGVVILLAKRHDFDIVNIRKDHEGRIIILEAKYNNGENGSLSIDHRRGIITLTPKPGKIEHN